MGLASSWASQEGSLEKGRGDAKTPQIQPQVAFRSQSAASMPMRKRSVREEEEASHIAAMARIHKLSAVAVSVSVSMVMEGD